MKIALIILLSLVCTSGNIFGSLDKEDQYNEDILDKLEDLKYTRGVVIKGRGKVELGGAYGSGTNFSGLPVRDYINLIQLDLDFLASPVEIIKLGATIRFENDISGYYGTGDLVDFRQLWAQVIVFRFVTIKVGTIFEKFTPFTLIAPVDLLPLNNPLFSQYRDISLYDNYLDHQERFPLEGANMDFGFYLDRNTTIKFKGLAAKLDDNENEGNSYDRYLFGSSAHFEYYTTASLKGTWVSIRDLESTGLPVPEYNNPLMNNVLSGQAKLDIAPTLFSSKDPIRSVGVEGEIAKSTFNSNTLINTGGAEGNANQDSDFIIFYDLEGYANQVNGFLNFNNLIEIKGGWRSIDYSFTAPGAQTRVATPGGASRYFADYGFSSFMHEYDYHNNISIRRYNNDLLNFTYPMNIATPNRTGLFSQIAIKLDKAITGVFGISSMEELRPVAAPNINKRSFSRQTGGVKLSISELIDLSIAPEISGFFILEKNSRNDFSETTNVIINNVVVTNRNETENCQVKVFGFSILYRIIKKSYIFGVYQQYSIKGIKTIDEYSSNQPIRIKGYTIYDYDIKNNVIGGGLIYAFGRNIKVQVDYTTKKLDDETVILSESGAKVDQHYQINNLQALFTVRF